MMAIQFLRDKETVPAYSENPARRNEAMNKWATIRELTAKHAENALKLADQKITPEDFGLEKKQQAICTAPVTGKTLQLLKPKA
ncbi:MAG: hypothetical protein PHD48_12795 [Alphaproteobacteria bacterium]|nr:hypothetical protein [Alphaproteobacteria bacterium]